ncbi:TetR/AcrR family transcriptional regulator [Streptomyces bambusae]|uniref:TetR family transcriptional regulator n=1 Tax=Streptomyces bambusae TaxID=1550616 RepID=A0ABS6ZA92_9ACTN|nr:TetR/AcrR family transcriptional regulator [Streptomyces bambusae]MBW5484143.1 TetR family transcriptional regulator [Streptomyces bambusae]
MDPVPPAHSLRRAPVQQRSADRLARILDACAELLDETGYENLSTRAVAVRAGVPIGSVYRFFDNKRAMADALAHRNLDRYAAGITRRLAALPATHWRPVVDAVLDEYLAMKRTAPGFALVDFGVPTPPPGNADPDGGADGGTGGGTGGGAGGSADSSADSRADSGGGGADAAAVADPNLRVAARLTELLCGHLGRTPDAALRRSVLVAVEATDALVHLAFRNDPSGDPEIVAETRAMLHAYLARVLD